MPVPNMKSVWFLLCGKITLVHWQFMIQKIFRGLAMIIQKEIPLVAVKYHWTWFLITLNCRVHGCHTYLHKVFGMLRKRDFKEDLQRLHIIKCRSENSKWIHYKSTWNELHIQNCLLNRCIKNIHTFDRIWQKEKTFSAKRISKLYFPFMNIPCKYFSFLQCTASRYTEWHRKWENWIPKINNITRLYPSLGWTIKFSRSLHVSAGGLNKALPKKYTSD